MFLRRRRFDSRVASWLLVLLLTALVAPRASAEATAAQRRADLATFRQRFLRVDRSYSPEARAEAEARLTRLEREADAVSQAYFELEIGRIVALADNGHTTAFAGPRSRHFNRVHLRLVPFGEEFHVLRAREQDADLLGARLVAIDGHPIAEVREVGRSLHGGLPQLRDRYVPYFLESPQQMHALGVIADANAATYRFRGVDGREVERRLVPQPANAERPRANSDRWLFPQPMAEEGDGWRPALPVAEAPWSLREPGRPFRWREAPEISAVVIDLRENDDTEDQRIGAFLATVERTLQRARPTHLVLDMRLNGGGDLTTTRAFMQRLPSLVPGRLFVLTSPWTFSAAISSIGYLEQAAPSRVTLVGEPVGDRLEFFSEGNVVELSQSGLQLLNATQRHDYHTGCRGRSDCHGNVVRHPIAVASLAPDIAAPWTIEAYLDGRDPAMEAVSAALARESR